MRLTPPALRLLPAGLAAALFAAPGLAQQAPANVPTSSAADAPICTDRPTKSTFACTVPKGRWQVEADAFSYTRQSTGGVTAETYLLTNPTLKYGISDSADLSVNWVPYARVETRIGSQRLAIEGVGDLTLRLKKRFTADESAVQFSLVPFVKLPTARLGIGNGLVEGGVIAPVNISLPRGWTLTVVPTLDILANADLRGGRHVQLQGLVNLGKQIGKVTLYGELWTAQNWDPAGAVRQYSADVALAYLISNRLQLDVGANIGLNRATPGFQGYLGVSARW